MFRRHNSCGRNKDSTYVIMLIFLRPINDLKIGSLWFDTATRMENIGSILCDNVTITHIRLQFIKWSAAGAVSLVQSKSGDVTSQSRPVLQLRITFSRNNDVQGIALRPIDRLGQHTQQTMTILPPFAAGDSYPPGPSAKTKSDWASTTRGTRSCEKIIV